MQKAYVINIQKYSIHDGEGIRTVIFFKGCPLACSWCHNPEAQSFQPELLYNLEKCLHCLACIPACPETSIRHNQENNRLTLSALCTGCGSCVDACLYDARVIAGRKMSVEELMQEIDKDAMFYEQSMGGVTLSGGEVMVQDMDYVEELLKQCRNHGYRVNIDTCGFAPFENFQRVLPLVDVFLYDIKFIDPDRHKKYTGCSNELILDNLVKLSKANAKIYIRVPLIEGINCSDQDMDAVLDFLKPLDIKHVFLLPYHSFGLHKKERMGLDISQDFTPPDPERIEEIQRKFQTYGYTTKIGG